LILFSIGFTMKPSLHRVLYGTFYLLLEYVFCGNKLKGYGVKGMRSYQKYRENGGGFRKGLDYMTV
jgi:hypothetical protein